MSNPRPVIPDTPRIVRLVQALIQNSFDIIKVVDHDMNTIFVSPSVERVLGYDPKDLLGTNPLDFVHPEDLASARGLLRKVVETGEMVQTNVRARHNDGSWRHIEVIVRDLRNVEDIDGFVFNYRDVTEQVEVEQRLDLYRERFEKAFRSCPDSITITAAIDGEIIEVNEGFEQISGYMRAEVLGRTTVEVGIWREPARRREMIAELKKNHRVRDFPIDVVTRGGEVRGCLVSAEILDIGGKLCVLAITRDITDQKEAEQKLQELTETLRREQVVFVQKNVALNEVLVHIEQDKKKYRHEISNNIDSRLRPMLRKLRDQGRIERRDFEMLERGLDEVTGEDIDQFKKNVAKLTPRELDILEMIRAGQSSKQIAEALDLSSQTVHKHRQSIRRKLQIDHRDTNLATFLRSQ